MPTATSYTNKIRYLSVAKNVKVQLPGGVSNTFRPGLSDMCSDFKTTTPETTTTTGGIITTIAGNGSEDTNGSLFSYTRSGLAVNVSLINTPTSVIADSEGNVFFTDIGLYPETLTTNGYTQEYTVSKIDTKGFITIATSKTDNAFLSLTKGNGYIYVSDQRSIYKLVPQGSGYTRETVYTAPIGTSLSHIAYETTLTFLATTSTDSKIYRITPGTTPENGITSTLVNSVDNQTVIRRPIAVDNAGNIYVTAISLQVSPIYESYVKKYNSSGSLLLWSINVPASFLSFSTPRFVTLSGITIGPDGNVYVSNARGNANRIELINQSGSTQTLSTVIGNGPLPMFSGDGGLASQSNLNSPAGIAFDSNANMYICDRFNYRIRKVTPFGTTTTPGKTTYNPPWFTPVEYRELCDCTLLTPTDAASALPPGDIIFNGQ